MHRMIQIRNVPEPLHRTLKARAAMAGTSLSAYLLKELTELAAVPTPQEMIARIERLEPIVPQEKPADVLRRARDAP